MYNVQSKNRLNAKFHITISRIDILPFKKIVKQSHIKI